MTHVPEKLTVNVIMEKTQYYVSLIHVNTRHVHAILTPIVFPTIVTALQSSTTKIVNEFLVILVATPLLFVNSEELYHFAKTHGLVLESVLYAELHVEVVEEAINVCMTVMLRSRHLQEKD
jgi:hypothetical protein